MRSKGLASLYKEALKTSQAELERRSAMEALRRFDNLNLTLGELVADLKRDWKTFSQLPLADVLEALGTHAPKQRGRKPGRPAGTTSKSAGKRVPKRLTKAVAAKFTESIQAYLAEHPEAKTKTIAADVGLTSKQAASLLGKLRTAKLVSTTGKAAGMRYTLRAAGTNNPAAPKKPTQRKKTARKKAAAATTKRKTSRKKAGLK